MRLHVWRPARRAALRHLTLALFLCAGAARATDILSIGGTGAALETFRILAADVERARAGLHVEMPSSLGSGGGIRALIDGKLDVALSSRPLSEEEKGNGLTLAAFGRTPLAFAVGAGNTTSAVTMAEVVEIYRGNRKVWGDGTPVRLVLRPAADADIAILRAVSPQIREAVEAALHRPGMIVADNDQVNATHLETLPGAFGMVSVAQVRSEKRRVKVLSLNGVAPTPEALLEGRYPIQRHFYMVTKDHPAPAVRALVDHLFSRAGQQTLRALGYVPEGTR